MCKQQLMLEEIIFKHHPAFKTMRTDMRKRLLHPDILRSIRLEKIVESAMESAGHLIRVKKSHSVYDFTDKSDCKTGSIFSMYNDDTVSHVGAIDGLCSRTRTGVLRPKAGAVRAVIYNPYIEELWYYYLPRKVWLEKMCNNRNDIRFTWNSSTNTIVKLDGYEVDSFKDLANIQPSDFND